MRPVWCRSRSMVPLPQVAIFGLRSIVSLRTIFRFPSPPRVRCRTPVLFVGCDRTRRAAWCRCCSHVAFVWHSCSFRPVAQEGSVESCRRSVSSVRTLFLWFGHVHARHSSFSPGSASDVGMRSNVPSQILVDKRTNATCDTSNPTLSIPLHPLSLNPSHPQSISQILSHSIHLSIPSRTICLTQCLLPSIPLTLNPSHSIPSPSMPVTLNPQSISLLDRASPSPLAVGFSANVCSLGRFHRDLRGRSRWRLS